MVRWIPNAGIGQVQHDWGSRSDEVWVAVRRAACICGRHPRAAVERFKPGLANWRSKWCGCIPVHHRAAEFLVPSLASAAKHTRDITLLFARARAELKWEQTYTVADAAVSAELIENYGFVELIGTESALRQHSRTIRHRDLGTGRALSSASTSSRRSLRATGWERLFEFNHGPQLLRRAGDVVYVPSTSVHGFRTCDEPFVALYIWQVGDLREKSTFV